MQNSGEDPRTNYDTIRAKACWPLVLRTLGRTHPALRAALRNAVVCASEGNAVVLGHHVRHSVIRLTLPKALANIETAYGRTFGGNWSVFVMHVPAGRAAA